MAKFVKVAEKRELSDGKGKVINIEGKSLAVFQVKDKYFALSDMCIHRGGPLGEGELDVYQITCPWHGWKFDIRTGSFTIIPTLKVKTYRVMEEAESILVEV